MFSLCSDRRRWTVPRALHGAAQECREEGATDTWPRDASRDPPYRRNDGRTQETREDDQVAGAAIQQVGATAQEARRQPDSLARTDVPAGADRPDVHWQRSLWGRGKHSPPFIN